MPQIDKLSKINITKYLTTDIYDFCKYKDKRNINI